MKVFEKQINKHRLNYSRKIFENDTPLEEQGNPESEREIRNHTHIIWKFSIISYLGRQKREIGISKIFPSIILFDT